MGEYGGHVPKRIQTEPVETPLIDGHLQGCDRTDWIITGSLSCPGCFILKLDTIKLLREIENESPSPH
jgi:hypothetical protein